MTGDACNHRLRALREETPSRKLPGRAMPRGELAELVAEHVFDHFGTNSPIDRKYIAKLEAGKIRYPNSQYREALRSILGVASDEQLGFVSANTVKAAKNLPPVDRRAVVNGTGALGGPDAVAPTATMSALSSAFEQTFGEEQLSEDDWAAKAEAYGTAYMRDGAADLQARLAAELIRLQSALPTNPRLHRVAARLLTVTGKTLPGVSGASGAIHWYRLGARAADRSGDVATRVWVRGRAALALAYEGAALSMARSLAEQALVLSEAPSLGRLNALLALAHVQGLQGDETGAVLTWGAARDLFDRVGSTEQVSDFAIPEWRMAVISSMLFARLGKERLALEAQATAKATMPDSLPRFATHLALHRGLMLVKNGEVVEGVAHARQALEALPRERHSLSLRLMMAEIERTAAAGVRQ